jgi:hypothetical protein
MPNNPPTVTGLAATASYSEGNSPVVIDNGVVAIADSPTLASATISITGNYPPGEDVLAFPQVAHPVR